MTATIHRLGPDDLPLFRAMNRLFGEAFDDPDTYRGDPPGDAPDGAPEDAYIRDLLAKDHVVALVALAGEAAAGGEVVGALVAYELDKFERARRELYIYDLAVAAAHRRRGIATRLIGEVRRIAKARGAWTIYVQADLEDGPAIALYTGLGTREDVLHFDIPPEP